MIQKFNWIRMLHIFFNTNKIVWYTLNIDLVNHRAQSWHSTKSEEEDDKDRIQWPSSKNQQTINAGEDVKEREHSFSVDRNVNWNGHYREQLRDSFKTKTKTTLWPNNLTTEHIPWGHNSKRHVCPSVHCSTIYSSMDMEAT